MDKSSYAFEVQCGGGIDYPDSTVYYEYHKNNLFKFMFMVNYNGEILRSKDVKFREYHLEEFIHYSTLMNRRRNRRIEMAKRITKEEAKEMAKRDSWPIRPYGKLLNMQKIVDKAVKNGEVCVSCYRDTDGVAGIEYSNGVKRCYPCEIESLK